jgi:hypothetical protein
MANQAGTLEILGREIGFALAPLEQRLTSGNIRALLGELGYTPADGLLVSVQGTIDTAHGHATDLGTKLVTLANAIEAGQPASIAQAGLPVIQAITALVNGIVSLANAMKADPDLAAFMPTVPGRLLEHVVIDYLDARVPIVAGVLELLGIIEREYVAPENASSKTIGHRTKRLQLHRIVELLVDPIKVLKELYGWGDADFGTSPTKSGKLFQRVHGLLPRRGLYLPPSMNPPTLDLHTFALQGEGAGLVVEIGRALEVGFATETALGDPWVFFLAGDVQFQAGIELQVTPPLALEADANVAGAGTFAVGVERRSTEPAVLLGQAGKSRLEVVSVLAKVGVSATAASGNKLTGEPAIVVSVKGGKIVIDTASGGALLKPLTSGASFEGKFDLGLSWKPSTGIKFDGSALELVFPTNVTLGPIKILNLCLGVKPSASGVAIELSGGVLVNIGPVAITIDRIGLQPTLSFPASGIGNVGPAQLDVNFKPPNGLGIWIDGGVVSGGGFVSREAGPPERFTGALGLAFSEISIGAFGILERTPSGSISFCVVLGIHFSPGIQLSYGLALSGVGGLIGINRRIDTDAIRERLTSGAASNVIFASDPVKNAPLLLGDLGAIMPVAEGIFVVGPTVQLSWLEIAKLDLAVILELPGPSKIIIVGTGRVELGGQAGTPPLVKIRLDVFGCIDFVQKLIAFDAALVDSKVFEMLQITGEAALRLSVGDKPYLILSIGGFHPSFKPEPTSFPRLGRLTATYETGLAIRYRIRAEAYFALTSNTLQVGAKFEIGISAGPLQASGYIKFDALIQFRPFYFEIQISAGFSLSFDGFSLAQVKLSGALSGPGPMVLSGTFEFQILFFSISWSDTVTFGSSISQPIQPVANVIDKLAPELSALQNLSTNGVGDKQTIPVARKEADATKTVVSPTGKLIWQQKRAPLDVTLERFEGAPLASPQAVVVEAAVPSAPVKDWFSPGTFIELSQSESLNKAAFERLDAGIEVGFGEKRATAKPCTITVKSLRLPHPTPIILAFMAFPSALMDAIDERHGGVSVWTTTPALAVADEAWSVQQGGGTIGGLTQTDAHQRARASGGVALSMSEAKSPIDLGAI